MADHGKSALAMTIIGMIFWLIAFLIMSGCTVSRPAVSPAGTVIDKDGPRVLILFDDLSGEPHKFAYNWFYFQQSDSIEIGDRMKIRKEASP
ncbi:hypothetical protein DN752_20965 [Echinicola strongylocentroti]|uniref:Uncharacterized protein n=1 Tax=Echinicola strongylocentroti TaxID=1795355 RepID=A0A2Z4INK0_9BACT|nr:hypothetical protein [Echinicola strongylocentroti]AWW32414.1 hypothetical protein DN752_20965 [Echinicola strongylocentroti]